MFSVTYPTRHTDTYAGTPFVHAGVLLALSELAYADFETHCGVAKDDGVFAVQVATQARYAAPLRWGEGAQIEVVTVSAGERRLVQEFTVRSAEDGRLVATFEHEWAWLDTRTGRGVPIPPDDQARFREG